MAPREKNGVLTNWKCLAACTLISMSPFQYEIDFTMIGGFQAMIGFLQVISFITSGYSLLLFFSSA